MAILKSNNGQFYQVPDEEAEKFLVPADKVEETLRAAGVAQQPQQPQQPQQQQPCCAPSAPAGGPRVIDASTVVIHVGGGGPPRVMQAGAGPQGQVQAYHDEHRGGHGGGGWWGFGLGYNNYYNYQNYMNHYGW